MLKMFKNVRTFIQNRRTIKKTVTKEWDINLGTIKDSDLVNDVGYSGPAPNVESEVILKLERLGTGTF